MLHLIRRTISHLLFDCPAARQSIRVALPTRALWLLLILAAVLYIPGLFWEFPLGPYAQALAVDEPKLSAGAANFPIDIVNRQDLRYPTLVHYSAGILSLPVRVVFTLAMLMGAPWATQTSTLLAITLVGRIMVLCCAVAAWILIYASVLHLTRSTAMALLATATTAFAPAFIEQSTVLLTNVPTALFFLLAALVSLCLLTVEASRLRAWALTSAVVVALGIGAKYSALPAAVMPVAAYLLNPAFRRTAWHVHARTFFLGCVIGGVVFTLTTPTWLVHPQALVQSFAYELNRVDAVSSSFASLFTDAGERAARWSDLLRSFGPLVLLIWGGILALGVGARFIGRSTATERAVSLKHHLVLLSGILAYVLLNGTALQGRYWVIALPVLSLWFGLLLAPLPVQPRARALPLAAAACVLAAGYAGYAVLPNYWHDPRIEAARWIAEHVPASATIATTSELEHGVIQWRLPTVEPRTLVSSHEPHDYAVLVSSGAHTRGSAVVYQAGDYRQVLAVLQQNPDVEAVCGQRGSQEWSATQQEYLMIGETRVMWRHNEWPTHDLCAFYLALPTEAGEPTACYELEAVFDASPPTVPRVTRASLPEIAIFRHTCAAEEVVNDGLQEP